MVEGWVGVGVITLVGYAAMIWRILVIERTLNERVDSLDRSLGAVVQHLVEKLENISGAAEGITLINQNPIGQIIEFLQGRAPQNEADASKNSQAVRDDYGQFSEVIDLDGETEN